jgi:hypothetical protein
VAARRVSPGRTAARTVAAKNAGGKAAAVRRSVAAGGTRRRRPPATSLPRPASPVVPPPAAAARRAGPTRSPARMLRPVGSAPRRDRAAAPSVVSRPFSLEDDSPALVPMPVSPDVAAPIVARRPRPLVAARRPRPSLEGRVVRAPTRVDDGADGEGVDADGSEDSFTSGLFIQAHRAGQAPPAP